MKFGRRTHERAWLAMPFLALGALAILVGCTSGNLQEAADPPPAASPPTVTEPTDTEPTAAPAADDAPGAAAQEPTSIALPTTPPVPAAVAGTSSCAEPAPSESVLTVIDLDLDGIDEVLQLSPPPGVSRLTEATLFVADQQGCPTVVGATGVSAASAGSPAGFACLSEPNGSLSFIDWEQNFFTYSQSGVDETVSSLVSWRRTSLVDSVPSTTSFEAFGLVDGALGLAPCDDSSRGIQDESAGLIVSVSPFNYVHARAGGSCVHDHVTVTPPEGWYAVQTEPTLENADQTYRCANFSPDRFAVPLQCDCYLPINISFDAGATLESAVGSLTVVREVTVNGLDAVIAEEFITSGLYDEFERWIWFIDKGDGVLAIEGSTAESSIPIAELAQLVDAMVASAVVHRLPPPDRPCASDPGDPVIGPTFYLDLNGDGTMEALAPEKFDASGTNVVTVHNVFAPAGECDWLLLQQLPRDDGVTGRQWECVVHPTDGLRLRTRNQATDSDAGESTAQIWAGADSLDFTTAEALALDAVPCNHGE